MNEDQKFETRDRFLQSLGRLISFLLLVLALQLFLKWNALMPLSFQQEAERNPRGNGQKNMYLQKDRSTKRSIYITDNDNIILYIDCN